MTTLSPAAQRYYNSHGGPIRVELAPACPYCDSSAHALPRCPAIASDTGAPLIAELRADAHALRLALATAHEAMGAARALLHELDASGNSSVAIGAVLMALEKATR